MCRIVRNQGPFREGGNRGRGANTENVVHEGGHHLSRRVSDTIKVMREKPLVATKKKKRVVKCEKRKFGRALCGVMIMLETLGFFHTPSFLRSRGGVQWEVR